MAETDLDKARSAVQALGLEKQTVIVDYVNGRIILTGNVVAARVKARIEAQVFTVVSCEVQNDIVVS